MPKGYFVFLKPNKKKKSLRGFFFLFDFMAL